MPKKIKVVNAARALHFVDINDLSMRHYGEYRKPYRYVSYDAKNSTIDIDNGSGGVYDVDLERCGTAAACLDWIHQLHVKIWFDAEREKEFIDLLLRLIPEDIWSGKD